MKKLKQPEWLWGIMSKSGFVGIVKNPKYKLLKKSKSGE